MTGQQLPIATLIASKPKHPDLLRRALTSVVKQQCRPDFLLLAFDSRLPDPGVLDESISHSLIKEAVVLLNQRRPGAAGAWNTGLSWLRSHGFDGYVAILDDDDEWDPDHLSQCELAGTLDDADVVLSGLRVMKDGVEIPRSPLSSVSRDDFLAGNPGWQGSNTFVKLEALMRVGGFTDGLPSTNDRDLAVRLLGLPDLKVAFTHRMTATWHIDSQADALSRPGSPQKRAGLLQFLAMHGHLMSPDVMTKFKSRARDLFGIDLP
ncbi:glycosyltransferase [Aquabacterium sp. A3]|uniref:glycosyltransferase n=1 Tax=Aquabacterium sp. A3 TaxID=3132829 RepID=UPI003119CE27